jgi:hypothetical protein
MGRDAPRRVDFPLRLPHAWVAACETCGWMGADHRTEEPATREALEHERDPVQPELVPWSPSGRTTQGTWSRGR